jgi:endonuclease G
VARRRSRTGGLAPVLGAALPRSGNRLALLLGVVGLLRRSPWLTLVAVLAGGAWYGYELAVARPAMVYMGVPQMQRDGPQGWVRVLRNDAFIAGYSEWLGNPLWVSFRVMPPPARVPRLPRPDRFEGDWRSLRCLALLACVSHDDYTGSGYDRGHLAPNNLIATRYGRAAQHQTFLMTNISPQAPNLNRKLWQRLEEITDEVFARRYPSFWVVTGPVFSARPQHLDGYKRIAVPEAFYKIFIRDDGGADGPRALAFLMPQTVKGNEDLRSFLVSIDEIERRTGLDFVHELPDTVEQALEAAVEPERWGLDRELATRPSRY